MLKRGDHSPVRQGCRRRARLARSGLAVAVGVFLAAGVEPGLAILDEAHSFALEIAAPQVEKGFSVRADYWSGEIKPGEKRIIRHQLFKGNEYWFWAGSSSPGARPSVSVYDLEGKLVQIESLKEEHMAAARVLPARTGFYLILIVVDVDEEVREKEKIELVDWALAYGYR